MSKSSQWGAHARASRAANSSVGGFFSPAAGRHTKRKPSIWAGPVGRQPSFWDWLTGDAKKEMKDKGGKLGGQHAKGKDDWLKRNMGI